MRPDARNPPSCSKQNRPSGVRAFAPTPGPVDIFSACLPHGNGVFLCTLPTGLLREQRVRPRFHVLLRPGHTVAQNGRRLCAGRVVLRREAVALHARWRCRLLSGYLLPIVSYGSCYRSRVFYKFSVNLNEHKEMVCRVFNPGFRKKFARGAWSTLQRSAYYFSGKMRYAAARITFWC